MKTLMKSILACLILTGIMVSVQAQAPKMKMTTKIPSSITVPDKVETSIGTLEYFDGVPKASTVENVYDYLDRSPAVEVYLNSVPTLSMNALREGQASAGADKSNKVCIFDNLMDSKSLFLTGNTSTMYAIGFLDLKVDGPTVIELPTRMLGILDDMAFLYMTDLGMAGPDKGQGGKFLVLPPDYTSDVPDGYYVVPSKTYGVWLFMCDYLDKGIKAASEHIRNNLKVYPLAQKDNPPEMEFFNVSGKEMNTIVPNDYSAFEKLHMVIQQEPDYFLGPEAKGMMAAIGIEKGKPFNPDARMQHIFEQAAKLAVAMARTNTFDSRDPDVKEYSDRQWETVFIGGSSEFEKNGYRNLDARSLFHYGAIVITPAMAAPMPEGVGSKYLFGYKDAEGQYLDGSKDYVLHIPPNVPVKDFWSVTIYDPATRSQLQTDQQFPMIGSQELPGKNPDGSIDIYFGPKPPKGKEKFWLQTIPSKGWFPVVRFYGPMNAYNNKTWKPDDVKLVKEK